MRCDFSDRNRICRDISSKAQKRANNRTSLSCIVESFRQTSEVRIVFYCDFVKSAYQRCNANVENEYDDGEGDEIGNDEFY